MGELQPSLIKLTSATSTWKLKEVGPTGCSADQVGQSNPKVGPPTIPFGLWVTSWAHLSMARGLASIVLVSCSGGPFLSMF